MEPSQLSVESLGKKISESSRCQTLVDISGNAYSKNNEIVSKILALSGKDDNYSTYQQTKEEV